MAALQQAAIALALALVSSAAVAVDFGRTEGRFDVTPDGAATYKVPIWTPPGPNGLTPEISIDYNSQAANGAAGVGWNVSATTSIVEFPRSS